MAEMLILLRRDPRTGKQNIVVKLESDPDALPVEHEQLHKRLVEKLVGHGLKAEDLGEVVITRDGDARQIGAPAQPPAAVEAERAKAGQGS